MNNTGVNVGENKKKQVFINLKNLTGHKYQYSNFFSIIFHQI